MNNAFDKEVKLKLLRLLQESPELTQREMNRKMGVSLGKINYCISALVQKGMIKIERFTKRKKKSVYIYHLTPSGIEELAFLTLFFLKIKLKEYARIKMEIKSLSEQMNEFDPTFDEDPELLENLKNIG